MVNQLCQWLDVRACHTSLANHNTTITTIGYNKVTIPNRGCHPFCSLGIVLNNNYSSTEPIGG